MEDDVKYFAWHGGEPLSVYVSPVNEFATRYDRNGNIFHTFMSRQQFLPSLWREITKKEAIVIIVAMKLRA